VAACLLLAGLLPAGAAQAAAPQLCLDDFPAGGRLAAVEADGGTFSLSFIHSVSLTPVTDHYRIEAGGDGLRIVQTSEVFRAHGAGLPSIADETDATGWRFGDGVFEILMQRPVDPLVVRVQPDYRNHLAFEGGQIDLTRWGERAVLIHACGDGRP